MRRRRLGAAREGRGWRRRATTARGVWLQCIFVERQVGRGLFFTPKKGLLNYRVRFLRRNRSTQVGRKTQLLRPTCVLQRGKTSKTQVGRKTKRKKKSPNTPSDGRTLHPYQLNPLYTPLLGGSQNWNKIYFAGSRRLLPPRWTIVETLFAL